MTIAQQGNLLEAVLWFAVAVALLAAAWRGPSSRRKILMILAAAFAAFGASDLIEMRTGAWWRPPWLLAMKGACVAVFVLCFWQYLRSRDTRTSEK
jgi:hypothetical protein